MAEHAFIASELSQMTPIDRKRKSHLTLSIKTSTVQVHKRRKTRARRAKYKNGKEF